jgi:hypothetical protein
MAGRFRWGAPARGGAGKAEGRHPQGTEVGRGAVFGIPRTNREGDTQQDTRRPGGERTTLGGANNVERSQRSGPTTRPRIGPRAQRVLASPRVPVAYCRPLSQSIAASVAAVLRARTSPRSLFTRSPICAAISMACI